MRIKLKFPLTRGKFDVEGGENAMNHPYKNIWPSVHESVFVAAGVHIVGDVSIGEQSSVWFNTVLRGDLAPVKIGRRTNIQDGSIGHVNTDQPLILEDDVSIGH